MIKDVIRQKEHLTTKIFLEEPTVVGRVWTNFWWSWSLKVFSFGKGTEWLSALDLNSVSPGLNPQSGL